MVKATLPEVQDIVGIYTLLLTRVHEYAKRMILRTTMNHNLPVFDNTQSMGYNYPNVRPTIELRK